MMLPFNKLQLEKEIYYSTVAEIVWLNSKFHNNHNDYNNHNNYILLSEL